MNIFKKNLLICGILMLSLQSLYAARLYIESPKTVSSNREPLTVMILLDNEADVVSGISGDLSFSSELFDVKSISTQNGIVSLWATSPRISKDNFFDKRTHVIFEGVVLGGFGGLRSPYSSEISPGIVFTITLTPKQKGIDTLTLDSIELHAYDSEGTVLPSKKDTQKVTVPLLSGSEKAISPLSKVDNSTVSVNLYTNELVTNTAPYLFVYDTNSSRTIGRIFMAESQEYDPERLSPSLWTEITNPYVLNHAVTKKYIHVKVLYANNTYTYATVQPVENYQPLSQSSRILIYILVVISLVYYYAQKFLFKNQT